MLFFGYFSKEDSNLKECLRRLRTPARDMGSVPGPRDPAAHRSGPRLLPCLEGPTLSQWGGGLVGH